MGSEVVDGGVTDRTGTGQGPGAVWTCEGCDKVNKASWRYCPGCQTSSTGQRLDERTSLAQSAVPSIRQLVLGVLAVTVMGCVVVWYGATVLGWGSELWHGFTDWFGERTADPGLGAGTNRESDTLGEAWDSVSSKVGETADDVGDWVGDRTNDVAGNN